MVKNLKESKSSDFIDNSSIGHAKILVAHLVSDAKKEIRLYTDNFYDEFYRSEEVKNAFFEISESFTSISIKIIYRNDLSNNKVFEDYKKKFANRFFAKKYSGDMNCVFEDGSEKILHNFMIVDDNKIRYELEDKQGTTNLQEIKARATFNRPKEVTPIKKAFDSIFNSIK
jgi:hypothetical protein